MATGTSEGPPLVNTSGSHQAAGSDDVTPASAHASPPENPVRKKQKFSRARTACLPCRARKSKCGALPPDPCQNCIDWELDCVWPAADGRSSQARIQRSKSANQASSGKSQGVSDDPAYTAAPDYDSPDWLQTMLSTASGSSQQMFNPIEIAPSTQTNGADTHDNIAGPSSMPYNQSNMFMPQFDPSFSGMFNTPNDALDPTGFMWAVSSQLPTVQESSPADDRLGPSPHSGRPEQDKGKGRAVQGSEGKIVKISWWRPHGQTAIAPGLKRITLKVRVDQPFDPLSHASPHSVNQADQDVIGVDGAPSTVIMKHLLDIFMVHFGCQFPFLDKRKLEQEIEGRTASVFLMHCIAGLAARFSTHPGIALPHLEPWAYGNVFYHRAKALLGSMLSVPSRDVTAGLVMLAHVSFANDSESELWMLTGMAVRMAIDLGLHINPPEESTISQEDRRLNRLVFFAVLLMDNALSFGVGRQTTFRVEDITQVLPSDSDIPLPALRSPFPFAAEMMMSYGPLINMLNRQPGEGSHNEQDIQAALAKAIRAYNQLPQDMQWNVSKTIAAKTKGRYFFIFIYGCIPSSPAKAISAISTAATPNSATASTLWRNSVRTIGDILVLSDIINPQAFLSIPFTNQAFFVASCCYVNEIEQHRSRPSSPSSSPRPAPSALAMTTMRDESTDKPAEGGRQVDLSRALLTSVARTNIGTLQSGLAKQAEYWSGVAWVMATLEKRIEGFQDVDLEGVTEKLKSFVSMPDAGLLGRVAAEGDSGPGLGGETAQGQFNYNDLDFLSLPFDLGAAEGVNAVTQTEIPLSQGWQTDWFR